jgi:hypothetical protein
MTERAIRGTAAPTALVNATGAHTIEVYGTRTTPAIPPLKKHAQKHPRLHVTLQIEDARPKRFESSAISRNSIADKNRLR